MMNPSYKATFNNGEHDVTIPINVATVEDAISMAIRLGSLHPEIEDTFYITDAWNRKYVIIMEQ